MTRTRFDIRNYASITAVLLVLMMTVLDGTLVNVALPSIGHELGVSDAASVWIVTCYQLTITMLLLPLSSAGDLQSYRRIFLWGVAIFTIASALCSASSGFPMLIASRTLQGAGAACVMGVNIALTRLIYPKEVLSCGLALNAMVIAIASGAGPTLSGAILSVASWRWLFLINIPLGLLAFIIGKRLLPANPPKEKHETFDWKSGIENAFFFGIIFLALGNLAHSADATLNIVLLAAGAAIGFFYVRRQRGRRYPMLPTDLFRHRLFTLCILTSVCSFIAQSVTLIALPFLFVQGFGFPALTTGLLITPWPIAIMITAPFAARLADRFNPGVTAAAGMFLYSIALVSLIVMAGSGDVSLLGITLRMTLCGIGFGLFQTPNNIAMVQAVPVERSGGAGGMQGTARLVGQTFGATLVTLIFASATPGSHPSSACLFAALLFSIIAAIFSLSRAPRMRKQEKTSGPTMNKPP